MIRGAHRYHAQRRRPAVRGWVVSSTRRIFQAAFPAARGKSHHRLWAAARPRRRKPRCGQAGRVGTRYYERIGVSFRLPNQKLTTGMRTCAS